MVRRELKYRRWLVTLLMGCCTALAAMAQSQGWAPDARIPSESGADGLVLPQDGAATHLGVSSCASSVCHGRAEPSAVNRVWLTEFRIWQGQDAHATSYATLLTDQSRTIATKMGIGDPASAAVCLNCHADNVPVERRGKRFQLSDGVGCEACHGGAEGWISSHTDPKASYAENLEAGLFPSASPENRAELCLSCHLGTSQKFASHDIMAGGHPQLLFETETFSINQPMHYAVDADYRARKGEYGNMDLWLHGLLEAAATQLQLITDKRLNVTGSFPDVALYHCDSCHRLTDVSAGDPWPVDPLRPSGSIPLNDAALSLIALMATTLEVDGAQAFSGGLDRLIFAASMQRGELSQMSEALKPKFRVVQRELLQQAFSGNQLSALRRALLTFAASGKARYFSNAFQVFLAINTLNHALQDDMLLQEEMQTWFQSIMSESEFAPVLFATQAARLLLP